MELLDDILRELPAATSLLSKLGSYSDFAQLYECSLSPTEPDWSVLVDTALGPVRVVGLNTALLSCDDQDSADTLALGAQQLFQSIEAQSKDELLIILQHHPPEWLADGASLEAVLKDRPHIQFSGHIHLQTGRMTKLLHGGGLASFVAGAGHAPRNEDSSHSYAFGALSRNGMLFLPRSWSPRQRSFEADPDYAPVMDASGAVHVAIGDLPSALARWLFNSASTDKFHGATVRAKVAANPHSAPTVLRSHTSMLSQAFHPLEIKGLIVPVNDPWNVEYIVDSGDEELTQAETLAETRRLQSYCVLPATVRES